MVSLSDLHRGALLNPKTFDGLQIKNKHLEIVTATGWAATNTRHFGLQNFVLDQSFLKKRVQTQELRF